MGDGDEGENLCSVEGKQRLGLLVDGDGMEVRTCR